MTLREAIKTNCRSKLFAIPNTKVDSFKGYWQVYKELTLPDFIVIIDAYGNCQDTCQVAFYNSKTNNRDSIILPYSLELIEAENDDVMSKYQNFIFTDNLRQATYFGKPIGSDPEVFAEDEKGKLIPAFNFLPAKEKNFAPINDYNKIYWDGFQAEFTTDARCCIQEHGDSVQSGLRSIVQELHKVNSKAILSIQTTFDIPSKLLEESKDEHVAFGCMPSFNVYGIEGLKADGRDVPFRSAGGHIHFGTGRLDPNKDAKRIQDMVRGLDAILGVACVSLFAKFDNPKRRAMYGLAGEYRLPPHGLEYRVLSNAWLSHPLIMHMVFDLARRSLKMGELGLMKHWEHNEEEVIRIINNCDVKAARSLLKANKKSFKIILKAIYSSDDSVNRVYDIWMEGMESVVKDPSDIIGNWNLVDGKWITNCNGEGKTVSMMMRGKLTKVS